MTTGKINVSVENIFPLIKKFLYSDHEIFLRELISNGTDATLKLKHLTSIGEAKTEYGSPMLEVKIDKEAKKIHITDQGIGMTSDEVEKYINQLAFSGAEEFLNKYDESAKDSGIIGHFGLGFYSAFMVASKVEIITKSYKDEPAAHWTCDGSPEFTLEPHTKTDRGTEIILHIAEDSLEFLEDSKISGLLNKYNKFMPIPIKFGTKTQRLPLPEGAAEDAKQEEIEIDNIINNPNPAWTKQPADLIDEDYKSFYHELYPMQFEEPLFNIHLNVDYPFHLTGILYFPKMTNDMQIQKDKIQMYQNQVFVTDNVEGIVPEFLMMLKGVVDSPDIPLNVSRSGLQADSNVKKISNYITRKVADKLKTLFTENREDFEKKWNDIKIVLEYGMLSEAKFYEKAGAFVLYPTVDDKYLTLDEIKENLKANQTDKNGKLVVLYAGNKDAQHSYIESAKEKVDINNLFIEINKLFQRQIKETGATISCTNLPVLFTHRTLLEQVFQNLISNALKYSGPGNKLKISISSKDIDSHWLFAVEDNGIGIDPEYFKKIFVIFQRLHNKNEYSGTGLGLAISQKIIEYLGGKIWVESNCGKGSVFYFTVLKDKKT